MNILESNRTERILNRVNETHNWPIVSTFQQDAEAFGSSLVDFIFGILCLPISIVKIHNVS